MDKQAAGTALWQQKKEAVESLSAPHHFERLVLDALEDLGWQKDGPEWQSVKGEGTLTSREGWAMPLQYM